MDSIYSTSSSNVRHRPTYCT